MKDVDCYHVSFEASGKVNFYLNPLDQDLNVYLAIYDSNDYLIDQSANGKGQNELINILVSSSLTYYIKVKHNDSSIPTGNNYHLRCKYYASGFVNDKVKIRFENHIFVRRAGHSDLFSYNSEKAWKDHKFRRSVNESWEDVHVNGQTGEYNAFDFAKSLNKKAAYESISMGLGQIMGFNHSASGYSSAEEMYDGFNIGHII